MNEKKIRNLERMVRRVEKGVFKKDLKGRELDRHGERGSLRLVSSGKGQYFIEGRFGEGWVRFPRGVPEIPQAIPSSMGLGGLGVGSVEPLDGSGNIVTTYGTVLVTTGETDATVNLPLAGDFAEIVVKKIDDGQGHVIIQGATIDGETTYELTYQWNFVRLYYYSSQWYVIANN